LRAGAGAGAGAAWSRVKRAARQGSHHLRAPEGWLQVSQARVVFVIVAIFASLSGAYRALTCTNNSTFGTNVKGVRGLRSERA
jgi:hypothetical protein